MDAFHDGRRRPAASLICTEFGCSRNVRRTPTFTEAGNDPAVRALITDRRIAGPRERAARFVAEVGRTR